MLGLRRALRRTARGRVRRSAGARAAGTGSQVAAHPHGCLQIIVAINALDERAIVQLFPLVLGSRRSGLEILLRGVQGDLFLATTAFGRDRQRLPGYQRVAAVPDIDRRKGLTILRAKYDIFDTPQALILRVFHLLADKVFGLEELLVLTALLGDTRLVAARRVGVASR